MESAGLEKQLRSPRTWAPTRNRNSTTIRINIERKKKNALTVSTLRKQTAQAKTHTIIETAVLLGYSSLMISSSVGDTEAGSDFEGSINWPIHW